MTRHSRFRTVGLEELEGRWCPSVFYDYHVLTYSGQAVTLPGASGPATIRTLSHTPSINSNGLAAFTAELTQANGGAVQKIITADKSDALRPLDAFGDLHAIGRINEAGKERARNNFPASWWVRKGGVVPLG